LAVPSPGVFCERITPPPSIGEGASCAPGRTVPASRLSLAGCYPKLGAFAAQQNRPYRTFCSLAASCSSRQSTTRSTTMPNVRWGTENIFGGGRIVWGASGDRRAHSQKHSAAQAEYVRSAALLTHQGPEISRPNCVAQGWRPVQCRQPFLSNSVLKPSGIRGCSPSAGLLHHGHGMPGAPHLQASGPSHGI